MTRKFVYFVLSCLSVTLKLQLFPSHYHSCDQCSARKQSSAFHMCPGSARVVSAHCVPTPASWIGTETVTIFGSELASIKAMQTYKAMNCELLLHVYRYIQMHKQCTGTLSTLCSHSCWLNSYRNCSHLTAYLHHTVQINKVAKKIKRKQREMLSKHFECRFREIILQKRGILYLLPVRALKTENNLRTYIS